MMRFKEGEFGTRLCDCGRVLKGGGCHESQISLIQEEKVKRIDGSYEMSLLCTQHFDS